MGALLNDWQAMFTEICCNCGIAFSMPTRVRNKFKDDGGEFYCPNGHGQHYTETTVMRLEKELADRQRQLEWTQRQRDSNAAEVKRIGQRLSATKGVVSRIRNRVGAGICPCCNRSFENLRRHMECKHKGYRSGGEKG